MARGIGGEGGAAGGRDPHAGGTGGTTKGRTGGGRENSGVLGSAGGALDRAIESMLGGLSGAGTTRQSPYNDSRTLDTNERSSMYPQSAAGAGGTGGAAATPITPAMQATTRQNAVNQIIQSLQSQRTTNALQALVSAGIITPQEARAGVVPKQYQGIFNREFNDLFDPEALSNLITPDMLKDNVVSPEELQQATTQAQTILPEEFGQNALSHELSRVHNANTTALDRLGWDNAINSALGGTADDAIIEAIINEQYNPAAQTVQNQFKRGVINQGGYDTAMADLGTQRTNAQTTLGGYGTNALSAANQAMGDWTKGIYGQATSTQLGSPKFNAASFQPEFQNQLNTQLGNVGSSIREQAGTSLFDPGLSLQRGGITSGMSTGGNILDTLAQRQQNNQSNLNRGVGSQGAF